MPPGRLTCVAKVRGRRTSSRVRKRLATAPLQKDEWEQCKRGLEGGDNKVRLAPLFR